MTLKDVINNLDEKGFSLLHLNAKDGNAETVQNLIEDAICSKLYMFINRIGN